MSYFSLSKFGRPMIRFIDKNPFNEDYSLDGEPFPPPTESLMITESGDFMITETLSDFMSTE